ncbi:uncharacterized protein LOC116944307 isoform X2 [Petromyzon marinus]|uniref:uncharacterized protein LOC116944307 isoform X2 n=1 Tax=Petromyzon marinus TaxID=7757 RepID=UPI003F71EBC0
MKMHPPLHGVAWVLLLLATQQCANSRQEKWHTAEISQQEEKWHTVESSRQEEKWHSAMCGSYSCMNGGICANDWHWYWHSQWHWHGNWHQGYYCYCPPGLYGLYCEYNDVCNSFTCSNGGICANHWHPYWHSGWHSGWESGWHSAWHWHWHYNNGYYCYCPPGWTGPYCDHYDYSWSTPSTDVCNSFTCSNGGICANHWHPYWHSGWESGWHSAWHWHWHPQWQWHYNNGYYCYCPPGWTGPYCDHYDKCQPNPCLNGGTCVDYGSWHPENYHCYCYGGYWGDICQFYDYSWSTPSTDVCNSFTCSNGGICANHWHPYWHSGWESGWELDWHWHWHPQWQWHYNNGYYCYCPPGWTGPYCDHYEYSLSTPSPDKCQPNPCLNGGTCVDYGSWHPENYHCYCYAGYWGDICQHYDYSRSTPSPDGASLQVNCTSEYMEFKIPQSKVNSLGLSNYDVHLEDSSCRGYSTGHFLVLQTHLQACGTTSQTIGDTVVYTNTAYGFMPGTKVKKLRIPLHCYVGNQGKVVASFAPRVHDQYSTAHFELSMKLYTNWHFDHPISSYPFSVELGDTIYVEVLLNSYKHDQELMLVTCKASPYPGASESDSYILLREGCPEDHSYDIYPSGDDTKKHFSFQSFEMSNGAQVYLECTVHVCYALDWHSRCRQGCIERGNRTARDVGEETHAAAEKPINLSQGPLLVLRKQRDASLEQGSSGMPGWTGMVYALAATLAISAVCVATVKIYWLRATKTQYLPLSTADE